MLEIHYSAKYEFTTQYDYTTSAIRRPKTGFASSDGFLYVTNLSKLRLVVLTNC